MHPNPIYHSASAAGNLAFARSRAFGTLAVNGAEGPLISHVPFLLSKDGQSADLHLMRSNPIARAADHALPAVIAVSGPDSYISPDWYGIDDQVPTWNYVAVHLRGQVQLLPQDMLRDLIDRESAAFEARLAPKPIWHSDKMDAAALDRMMRMIVPVRFQVASVDGTWKLSQNKPPEAQDSAARHVAQHGFGLEPRALADRMGRP